MLSHKAHSDIIELEESGKLRDANLLIIHSEDQMMSVETFKVMAEKFIRLKLRYRESYIKPEGVNLSRFQFLNSVGLFPIHLRNVSA